MSNTTFPLVAVGLFFFFFATRTFALHDVGGAVEVRGCVSRTGHAVVLAKLPLVGASWTADAAVGAGVVVVSWRALDCKEATHSIAC